MSTATDPTTEQLIAELYKIDVDLLGDDVMRVFRFNAPVTRKVYCRGEITEAEPAVPGWTFPVDELFD